ncbi:SDR family oxidoreductase [Leifsonia soli]
MSTQPLSGRTALVTGAGRGIGRAVAVQLAGAGAQVGLLGRTQEQLDETLEIIRDAGGHATSLAVDLSVPPRLVEILDEISLRFERVDILINNAATVAPLGPTEDVGLSAFRENIDLNVIAPVAFSARLAPAMRDRGWGRIVNVTSGVVERPESMIRGNAYVTGKAALEAHTLNLAAEFAHTGVTINAFRPGNVDTAMQAWIRAQNPDTVGPELHARFQRWFDGGTLTSAEHSASTLIPRLLTSQTGRIWSAGHTIAEGNR